MALVLRWASCGAISPAFVIVDRMSRTHQIIFFLIALLAFGTFVFAILQFATMHK